MDENNATSLILSQVEGLLAALPTEVYIAPLAVFNGSSIGQHVRHVIEIFACLVQQESENTLCYDFRERNQAIETNVQYALQVINELYEGLSKLHHEKPLVLKVMPNPANDEVFETQTTVGRELIYGFDHAVHHLAIVKIGLQVNFPEITVSQDLGVAPSTVKYRASCAP